ncbi:hypothetical protein DSUL_20173 [Desulfovibrionales bacterium]
MRLHYFFGNTRSNYNDPKYERCCPTTADSQNASMVYMA